MCCRQTDEDAIRILEGAKADFERFHGVVLSRETIQTAVFASGRFLRHRPLPERAIDLIDDACARVKLRRNGELPEIRKLETRIRLVVRQMEDAIVSHDFEKARKLSEEEREGRKTIARLREELPKQESSNTVSRTTFWKR
jgi:ATP-dependent Clp protease ATP-binding subunit ClpC